MSDDAPVPRASQITALVEQAMQVCFAGGEARMEEFCGTLGELSEPVRLRLAKLRRIGLLGREGQAAPAPESEAAPERLGDFELLELLGRGGMGVVYRARQVSLDREVAVKLIRPEQVLFPGVRERFRREVEVIARLQHDGIVRMHCFGEDRGVPWFAMELVRGCSLAGVIARHVGRAAREMAGADVAACLPDPVADGPGAKLFAGSWEQCIAAILERAALALDEAHRQGVIHRDVKPSNVMVTAAGRVVLLDFGLAASRHAVRLTRSGAEIGTVHYMAPEQFRGADVDADVDERADVYALGVVLRELLTLRPAFDGATIDEVARQLREGLTTPIGRAGARPDRELETVCLTAMDRDPSRRYASARLFARDLRNWLERRPVTAVRPTLGLRLVRTAQRHRTAATALALLVLAAVLAPAFVAWRERGLRRDLEQTNAALVGQIGRADGNLHTAAEALAKTMELLRNEQVHQVPDLKPLVDRVVDQSDAFLVSLAASNPTEPTTRLRVAEVLVKAAFVQWESREIARTEALFARAVELLDRAGGDVDRRDEADLEARQALVQIRQQRAEARTAAYEEALARVRPHGEAMSRPVAVRVRIARCHELLALGLPTNDPRRFEHLALSHRLNESCVAGQPTLEGWLAVARSARILAMDRRAVREAAAAEQWNRVAADSLEQAEALSAGATPEARERLAEDQTVSGTTRVFEGRHAEALLAFRRAEAHFAALMRERPSRLHLLLGWLQTRESIGDALLALDRRDEAREVLGTSLRRATPAFELWPDDPVLLRAQLSTLRRLVEMAVNGGTLDAEAKLHAAVARSLIERVEASRMKSAALHEQCSRCLTQQARMALQLGDAAAALAATQRGEALFATAKQQATEERLQLGGDSQLDLVATEALLRLGREDAAAARLETLRYVPKDLLHAVPSLKPLEGDPRFAKTFARMRGKK